MVGRFAFFVALGVLVVATGVEAQGHGYSFSDDLLGYFCVPNTVGSGTEPGADVMAVQNLAGSSASHFYAVYSVLKYEFNGAGNLYTTPADTEENTPKWASLGPAGFVVGWIAAPIDDLPGDDVAVHETPTPNEDGYCVYGSDAGPYGPWTFIGVSKGSPSSPQSFDLASNYTKFGGAVPLNYIMVVDHDKTKDPIVPVGVTIIAPVKFCVGTLVTFVEDVYDPNGLGYATYWQVFEDGNPVASSSLPTMDVLVKSSKVQRIDLVMTDGTGVVASDSHTIVAEACPPTITAPDLYVYAGQTLVYEPKGWDPVGAKLGHLVSNLPPGATFDGARMQWHPGDVHIGTWPDIVARAYKAADPAVYGEDTFTVFVLEAEPPGDSQPDADLDGIVDALDNCPLNVNYDQLDADGDGVGDACETPEAGGGVGGGHVRPTVAPEITVSADPESVIAPFVQYIGPLVVEKAEPVCLGCGQVDPTSYDPGPVPPPAVEAQPAQVGHAARIGAAGLGLAVLLALGALVLLFTKR